MTSQSIEDINNLSSRRIVCGNGDIRFAIGGTLPRVINEAHLERQAAWSLETFGPGRNTDGVIDHIEKELVEIKEDPYDLKEWVDVIILALDGAWRAGHAPQEIIDAIIAKQIENEGRKWPDWRTAEPGKAIEHIRD